MNELSIQRRKNFIRKLVANARAIVSNQIAIPMGMLKMDRIIRRINDIEPISGIDLQVFFEYNSKTTPFLVGTERLYAEEKFLIKQDKELDALTIEYKDQILHKCREIISQFSNVT